jgi:hypothetical protein
MLVDIANPPGSAFVACNLVVPPIACLAAPQNASVFRLGSLLTSINLASLELNFTGASNELPPGTWTIYLINWNLTPIQVTTGTAILASPP